MEACRCDLCGNESYQTIPQQFTGPQRVVICCRCGLIYTNPRWDEREIIKYYAEEFKHDPGALALAEDAGARAIEGRMELDRRLFRSTLLPLIKRHVDPKGKKWLEVRFRTGAALAEVKALGAEIHGVDIFERNVAWMRQRLDCSNLHVAPVQDLLAPVTGVFDVISMVTIHVAAHTPSPSKLFNDVYDRLAPNGLLILEEKDVTQVPLRVTNLPLRGKAHYHHLTLNSTKALVRKAGFELLHASFCSRVTALRHFAIVARKGAARTVLAAPPVADDPDRLYRRLMRLHRRILLVRKCKQVLAPLKRAVGLS